MQISPHSLSRFLIFLEKIAAETYPEEVFEWHQTITIKAMEHLFDNFSLPVTAQILDVGCGQGVALELFKKRGYSPIGVTLNEIDANVCNNRGFNVHIMDQSFLDFEAQTFELIWARHVVEHSFMPLYTLTEFKRILKPGGILYLEVPAPDTLLHEDNPNHYSILGRRMWESLLARSGFSLTRSIDFQGSTADGRADEYWGYFASAHSDNQNKAI